MEKLKNIPKYLGYLVLAKITLTIILSLIINHQNQCIKINNRHIARLEQIILDLEKTNEQLKDIVKGHQESIKELPEQSNIQEVD